MAAYYHRGPSFVVKKSEATAAKRTIYYDIGTDEAQVITVSKNGGAPGATAGTVETTVAGLLSKLVFHVDDIDTVGVLAVVSTGATDTQYLWGYVVEDDPFNFASLV